jgi:3-hydroxymyristoyl/3-hydroxydecanoyl-(acyl carrier protein) dehydratase
MEHCVRDFPIDQIVSIETDSIIVHKFIPFNESIFDSHFVDMPIYPGSLILNSVIAGCQHFCKYYMPTKNIELDKVKKCFFKYPCFPGDVLEIENKIIESQPGQISFLYRVTGLYSKKIISNGRLFFLIGNESDE